MSNSNYPPGVSGNEWQITGECPCGCGATPDEPCARTPSATVEVLIRATVTVQAEYCTPDALTKFTHENPDAICNTVQDFLEGRELERSTGWVDEDTQAWVNKLDNVSITRIEKTK